MEYQGRVNTWQKRVHAKSVVSGSLVLLRTLESCQESDKRSTPPTEPSSKVVGQYGSLEVNVAETQALLARFACVRERAQVVRLLGEPLQVAGSAYFGFWLSKQSIWASDLPKTLGQGHLSPYGVLVAFSVEALLLLAFVETSTKDDLIDCMQWIDTVTSEVFR
jgi:hypothetical protein